MRVENIENKIGKVFINKEKTTGIWKVSFKYTNTKGKIKRYYDSEGLNDSKFFQLDLQGKKKVNATGVVLKNIKEREALAKRRIELIQQDLTTDIFDINKGCFFVGEKDKSIIELMRDFIQFKENENTVNAKSILQYTSKVNGFENWLELNNLEGIELTKVDKFHISDFYTYLFSTTENKKPFSKKYRDDYNRFFVGFYNHLINFKDLDIINPMKTFKNIDVGKTQIHKATNVEDLEALVNELKASNYYLGVMYQFIFFTLNRVETLVQIKREFIDLERNLIYLPASIIKNNEEVTITIAPHLRQILIDYLDSNNVLPTDFLFGRVDGKIQLFGSVQSRANTFSALFSNLKKTKLKANIPTLIHANTTLYSAKHSGIKFLMDNGFSANQIISITGHRDVKQLGTYAKDYKAKKIEFPPLPVFK
ncbi:hypothetical protein KO02_19510 [Sphingobacterium sp. ML3W]|uniref:tyrosine-type recombinase/integrase n=1 Tax=Sphingobacterium sp. ML3W TaxID=1538644 RepID=UPI0004F69FC2|nr:tyrosine-type recombinase/integrase [Sphingobacterium sp. ML3W]AIM38638.1 hypothetical protein KO02_19510 [Sphingobacterium sp. ML3W]